MPDSPHVGARFRCGVVEDGIGVVDGQGWQLAYTSSDGARLTVPVVGWIIDADGWGTALIATNDGSVAPLDSTFTDAVVTHPDEREQSAGDAA